MIVVVKSRQQLKRDLPVVTHNADGSLTRAGALVEARKKYGDMGTISSDERLPRLVWCIGQFNATVGRGLTWERALKHCRPARVEPEPITVPPVHPEQGGE